MFLSPLDASFWIYLLLFIVSVFLAFFIPGAVLVSRLKLGLFQTAVLGIMLGVALWIWQGFLFGFLGVRILTYVYLAGFFALWVFQNKESISGFGYKKIRLHGHALLIAVLFVGVIVQVLCTWSMGIRVQSGIYFCCGNVKDEVYHIGLTDQIVKNFPPYEPGMSDVVVKNYHYLSNLITADLVRVFHLPLVTTQYQFMTIFLSLFLGLTAISFAKSNKLSLGFMCWLLFFLYFSGDFIYLILIFLGKGLSFSMGSLEDGSIFLVNPPRAYAIVMLFSVLSVCSLWVRSKRLLIGLIMAAMGATLIGLKVYIGLFALSGFAVLGLYFLIRRQFKMCLPLVLTFLGSLVFYLPVNQNAGGLYFTQFWLFENFVSQPQFGLIRLELARTIYQEHKNYLRMTQYELMYIAFYVIAIFGSKVVAFFQTKKSLRMLPLPIHIILLTGIIVSLTLGFFFQQTTGGSNSFNFTVSVFILISVYAALAVSYWLRVFPKPIAFIVGLILILVTVPRVVNQTIANAQWIYEGKGSYITTSQMEVLENARKITDPNSVLLVDDRFLNMEHETSVASFITDRKDYFSGKEILTDHHIPTKEREKIMYDLLYSSSSIKAAKALATSHIDYIIMEKDAPFAGIDSGYYTKVVYKNSKGKILEVLPRRVEDYIKKVGKHE